MTTVSDLDVLLFLLCFSSYVTFRFLFESGFFLGILLLASLCVAVQKTSEARHHLYLYLILLFTTSEEQKWLREKFEISSNCAGKAYIKTGPQRDGSLTATLNKGMSELWPYASCYVEEQIRVKMEKLKAPFEESKLKPLLAYLVNFRTKEINLGSNPPKLLAVECNGSRDMKSLVFDVSFEFSGSGCLKYATHLKNITVANIKLNGKLRIELGPFLVFPPFFHDVKFFLTEMPQLGFTLANTPDRILNLAQILTLEKISDILVMPNSISIELNKMEHMGQLIPPGVIFLHIVQAKNLPNKETIGTSDPYCIVQLGHQKAVSNTIKRNLNPVWNFASQMVCYSDPSSGGLDVSIVIQDEDLGHEVFHDCLLRCKLNVRRIMEEGFVDEWLEEDLSVLGDYGKQNRGAIRVQAAWQKLSVDKAFLIENYSDVVDSEDGAENETVTDDDVLHSNLEKETNSSESISVVPAQGFHLLQDPEEEEPLLQHKRKKKTNENYLFNSILVLWIDCAKNLWPSWEDFQFEIEVYEKVERSSFVARDKRHRWSWRRRLVFPVSGHLLQDLRIKIFSRTRGKCCCLTLPISKLMKAPGLELNWKDVALDCGKNRQDTRPTLDLSAALRIVEALPDEASKQVNEAQNEARSAAVRHYWRETAAKISASPSSLANQSRTLLRKESFIRAVIMGWDVLPSFVITDPYFEGNEKNRKIGPSKKKRTDDRTKHR